MSSSSQGNTAQNAKIKKRPHGKKKQYDNTECDAIKAEIVYFHTEGCKNTRMVEYVDEHKSHTFVGSEKETLGANNERIKVADSDNKEVCSRSMHLSEINVDKFYSNSFCYDKELNVLVKEENNNDIRMPQNTIERTDNVHSERKEESVHTDVTFFHPSNKQDFLLKKIICHNIPPLFIGSKGEVASQSLGRVKCGCCKTRSSKFTIDNEQKLSKREGNNRNKKDIMKLLLRDKLPAKQFINTKMATHEQSRERLRDCYYKINNFKNMEDTSKLIKIENYLVGVMDWKNLGTTLSKLLVKDKHAAISQRWDRIKDFFHEVTEFKDYAQLETKPFENEEKSGNKDELMQILLSQKHFRVRTNISVYYLEVNNHPQAIDGIPWRWLNEEKWRLHTFSRYPHSANKSAILLAKAGFAYIGSGRGSDDKVICFFCCAVKENWRVSDDITLIHKNLSPNCSIVTGISCTNVPMTVPEKGNNLFVQLKNSRDLLANEDERPKTGYGPGRDAIETDSDHASGLEANQRHQSLSVPSAGNNRNVTPTHDTRHFQLANQTVSKPSPSSPSASVQPAGATRQTYQQNSGVSSSTVNSQRSPANHSVNEVSEHRNQADSAQESRNNTSSTRPAVQTSTQNVQQMLSPTPTSSPSTVSPQASQADVSSNQNISTVVVSEVPISSATVMNTTTSTTCSMNTDPPQGQGNTSQAGTGETQNNPRAAGRTPTYAELGIITERPKRYEFAVRAKRFESFEPWPRDHHLRKEDLADAGFYYAGYGDCARCFYCGGGLRNWEDNDNVWVEHARWFPKCAFIRQAMGQPFVDTVQELNRSNDQITFEMVTDKMGSSAATFQLDTKNMPLKRDPAIMTVLGMGYNEKDVFEAADFVKESSGFLSADKLYEKLEQDGKSRNKRETPSDSQAVRNNPDMSKDEAVMNQLREQNSQLRQQTVCKICMDKEVAVVFLPCGHLVSCTDCAAALKDCPVCRNPVRGIVRAFMA